MRSECGTRKVQPICMKDAVICHEFESFTADLTNFFTRLESRTTWQRNKVSQVSSFDGSKLIMAKKFRHTKIQELFQPPAILPLPIPAAQFSFFFIFPLTPAGAVLLNQTASMYTVL